MTNRGNVRQAAYDLAVQNGQEDAYLPKLDGEQIRDGIDCNGVGEEYRSNPELFCFSSIEDLEYYLDRRLAGEVLFAGTVARSYAYPLQDVFNLIYSKSGDYGEVIKFFSDN